MVAFSYHINTDALLALVDDLESFPLYGQYVKKKVCYTLLFPSLLAYFILLQGSPGKPMAAYSLMLA
jgi:hypothetical protein